MIRPTLRAVLFFSMGIPLALLIVAGWPEQWYLALYWPVAIVFVVLADLAGILPNKLLTIETKVPVQLYIGEEGHVNVKLSTTGYNKNVEMEALLEFVGEARDPERKRCSLSGDPLEFTLKIQPSRRGQIDVRALWLRWWSPFKFLEIRRRYELNKNIAVVPNIKGIHESALHFFSNDNIYGSKTQRLRGGGTEFDNLCEYAQGMDSRFIDWKRSARHRKLLCKEFRQERNHQIVFVFDTGHLMMEPVEGMPKLDHAIKSGLLLGWISLRCGDLIGGCGFDVNFRKFIKPGRGMTYFNQFQRFTSSLEYNPEETNFTLGLAQLNSRLQRRALVIIFTEFVDSISAELLIESLQLISRRHVVVFVTMRDPMLTGLRDAEPENFSSVAKAVIADDFIRERSIVLEKVTRLGVHCLDASPAAISSALINKYLMIKQRGLL